MRLKLLFILLSFFAPAVCMGQETDSTEKARQDSLAVTDVNDLADYLYSLSGMADLRGLPREEVVSVLEANMSGGVLRVPKEYGMFAAK